MTEAAKAEKHVRIGDVLGDKTVYAGELNGKKIYAEPEDAGLTMGFNDAADYADKLNQENYLGHNDWRVPTEDELNVLHKSKDKGALKGTFNLTGSDTAGYYWSAELYVGDDAYDQRFSTGGQNVNYREHLCSVRCVR
jgi:hypothetical protein